MLPNWYNIYKQKIDRSIMNFLTEYFESEKNKGLDVIKESAIYACMGGKRIRAILALEFYLIFSGKNIDNIGKDDDILKLCTAIELLHAYSLVHDDLPCMDNDEYRRGKETVWKKYGETNAILVGDLLNSLAFELTSNIWNYSIITLYLSQAVGIKGMLGGQVLDLYYENNPKGCTLDNLIETHNKKTGSLIIYSIYCGIILAEKDIGFVKDEETNNIKKFLDFGKKIGLAFQVKDDLLDVEGSIQETGKSVGGENKGFVYFMGIEKTKKYLKDILTDCEKIISPLKSEKLNFLVEYIGNRKK